MRGIKGVLLGEGRVGKTSLATCWGSHTFDPHQKSTIQAATVEKVIDLPNEKVNFILWDTAGQELYHSIAPIYYKDAKIAILVYSVTDMKSFDRMVQWHQELTSLVGEKMLIVIVANKIDLIKDRVIPTMKGVEFALSVGSELFEVSAKSGEGVDLLFRYLMQEIPKIIDNPSSKKSNPRGKIQIQVTEESKPSGKNGGCC